jgi:hypothetical protein
MVRVYKEPMAPFVGCVLGTFTTTSIWLTALPIYSNKYCKNMEYARFSYKSMLRIEVASLRGFELQMNDFETSLMM